MSHDAESSVSSKRRRFWPGLASWSKAYAFALACVLMLLEWRAEACVPLAVLLFLPPVFLLLPLIVLAPVALILKRWRLLVLHALCVLVVLFGYMTFRYRPKAPDRGFTVVTHNIGQGIRSAFITSFPNEQPDVIILQDVRNAPAQEREYKRRYPAYRNTGIEQFLLLTPHEIRSATAVPDLSWRGRPVAARFVLTVRGRELAVYAVHLPTPRNALNRVVSRGGIMEMVGIRDEPTDGFASYRDWLDARVSLGRSLVSVLDKETLPMLAGGDFNTPDHGIIYHAFASRFTDAHKAAGSGWGFTFPGGRERRVARVIGHWMRLDYWFSGQGWKPVECRVSTDDESQHRAVLARYEKIP